MTMAHRELRHAVAAGALLIASATGGCLSAPVAPATAASQSVGCARQRIDIGRRLTVALDVDGSRREFILDVPESVRAGRAAPLVFDFHGFGHSGAGVWKVSGFKDIAATRGFITVYPEGLPIQLLGREPKPGWEIQRLDGNRDLAFVRAMLERIEADYCIDRDRVFATGFSNGAFLSHILGCAMSERFAAIAPVGGGDLFVACAAARAMPVLIHHGKHDQLIPIAKAEAARDGWALRNGCGVARRSGGCASYEGCRDGGDVEYCEEDVAHTWPAPATERIWSFFEAHPRR